PWIDLARHNRNEMIHRRDKENTELPSLGASRAAGLGVSDVRPRRAGRSQVHPMSFREALELLYRRGNEVLEIHPGLRRIRVLMEALGNPHLKFPALHIAGTNGKGSVAAMAESMLRTAGWRTGLFTSPHLERIQERIRINGSEISSRPFASLISRISSLEDTLLANARLDARLTFFELVTAAAFLYFAEQEVDIGVIEVGLGGRWDATNIVRPRTCVITGISYDHTDILGGTL